MKSYQKALTFVLTLLLCTAAIAQEPENIPSQDSADSLKNTQDSIIESLRNELQEMKLQSIILQNELERTGQIVAMDSLMKVQRRDQVDSLRKITPGAPLVVDEDTLLRLYARRGGVTPENRVENASRIIDDLGHKLAFRPDSLYVFEGDFSSDIMAGNELILSITDMDALWQDTSRSKLAEEYAKIIQKKIDELQEEYGLRKKLWGLAMVALIILAQYMLLRLTNIFFRRWRRRFARKMINILHPVNLKDYELLNTQWQRKVVLVVYKGVRYFVILLQLSISIPLMFSIFPETKVLTLNVLAYIWEPVKGIILSFLGYLPNILQIIIIWMCFYYVIKLIRYFAGEIENGRLKINGFYPDWAQPTFYILRVLLYSLMFVMIWPLLPNSNSQIFQGVSVFIGIVVSLGSTSIIGNIMAGMVMTYMRPFRIGDYIQVGDTTGEVIEKTMLVTRIRTRKNEIVTIQNSSLLGSQTSNFTVAARNYGIIVHTKVTIGYDVPWQKIKKIMESAALETPGIQHTPAPFMMITALNDFYVEYEINAVTKNDVKLPAIYSALHQNLLKRFFEEGVEIMSPHIYARRDGIDVQMPSDYLNTKARNEDKNNNA